MPAQQEREGYRQESTSHATLPNGLLPRPKASPWTHSSMMNQRPGQLDLAPDTYRLAAPGRNNTVPALLLPRRRHPNPSTKQRIADAPPAVQHPLPHRLGWLLKKNTSIPIKNTSTEYWLSYVQVSTQARLSSRRCPLSLPTTPGVCFHSPPHPLRQRMHPDRATRACAIADAEGLQAPAATA